MGERHNNPGRARREMAAEWEAEWQVHRKLEAERRAALTLDEREAEDAARAAVVAEAEVREKARRAENRRIQEALHALAVDHKRGTRYLFEGNTYVRRRNQYLYPGALPYYFKRVP